MTCRIIALLIGLVALGIAGSRAAESPIELQWSQLMPPLPSTESKIKKRSIFDLGALGQGRSEIWCAATAADCRGEVVVDQATPARGWATSPSCH